MTNIANVTNIKHLTLTYPHDRAHGVMFCVESVTNSVDVVPGEYMSRDVVAALADDESWHVFVKLEDEKPIYATDRALMFEGQRFGPGEAIKRPQDVDPRKLREDIKKWDAGVARGFNRG